MAIRVMLFDLWGTLLDDASTAERREGLRRQSVRETLRGLGFDYDDAAIGRAFTAASEEHGRIHLEGRDISAEARTILHLRHLDESLAEQLDDAGWQRLHEAVLTPSLHVPPEAIPHAVETLAEMKSLGLSVGLISNAGTTPGFVLSRILDGYGMLQYFDDTIFSDEVELAKPAAAIFEEALDRFGVQPKDAAFIGDQPVLDVLGPQGAGLWSIQLGDLREDGIEPHKRIARLTGLAPALRELELL